MRPSQLEPYGSERRDRRQTWAQDHLAMQAQSHQSTRRSRFEDSWIDISSQPSSSSLASQNDEIITTGLSVRRDAPRQPRQLRLSNMPALRQPQSRSTSVSGSSQDEYEESESESDRVLSSSNEDISNTSNAEEEVEDDTQTALGIRPDDKNIFTPQPNAFSHPPQSQHPRSVPVLQSAPANDSYFPTQPHAQQPPPSSSHRLPSNRVPTISRPMQQRTSSNMNISTDHDAALRASLTTLLSCANAVHKKQHSNSASTPAPTIPRNNAPTTLHLVAESELNDPAPRQSPKLSPAPKRKSRESSKERQAKKFKAVARSVPAEDLMVSPTMMTWFISAGVVLVFSAISFSAGYAWGKEVGRVEGQLGLEGASCGRDVVRGSRSGLSKLRLGAVGA